MCDNFGNLVTFRARKDASAKRQDLAPPKNLVRNVKGKEPRASHRVVAEEANKAGSVKHQHQSQILNLLDGVTNHIRDGILGLTY